jgi:hypothetical protein
MTFNGWYTEANGGAKKDSFSELITVDTTFYARWEYILPLISVDEASIYLTGTSGVIVPANGVTASDPAPLPMNMDLGSTTTTDSGWANLLAAIGAAGKYVALDLSPCAMTGTAFGRLATAAGDAGKDRIVSIILPNAAISISAFAIGGTYNPTSPIPSTPTPYTNLASVSADAVTTIGVSAFRYCTSLSSVSFPEATDIGDNAFSDCTSLNTVSFPEATDIGFSAFYNCTSITSASFPKVTSIGISAFYNCTSLTSITITANVDFGNYQNDRFGTFNLYYASKNKAAGTYTWDGSAWTGPN